MGVRFSVYPVLFILLCIGKSAKAAIAENRSLVAVTPSMEWHTSLLGFSNTYLKESNEIQMRINMQASRYLRLQLHVDDSLITVTNAKEISGPVLQLEEIHLAAGIIYEARRNDKRLNLGAIPYDALFTSFIDLRRDEERPSSLADVGAYNIHIEIPLTEDFGLKELNELEIVIYDLQEPLHNMPISEDSIAVQFPKKIKQVAQLKCIDIKRLPDKLQKELYGILEK